MTSNLLKDKWLWLLITATFAARLIYLLQLNRDIGFQAPMVDELWHWQWAHDIFEKSFWGEGAYFRAPLYPYVLAVVAKITGNSILFSKILQSLFSCGTVFFLYKLARHLFNTPTAVITGFIYALFGSLVFYETMFLIPVLFLFLVVWGMYRVVIFKDSKSNKTWFLTGIVFGLAAITRPNILIVMPFIALWLFVIHKSSNKFINKLKIPAILAVGVITAITPVTIRNIIATGEFMLISSQGGINFYIGNNPEASGLSMRIPEVDNRDLLNWKHFQDVTKMAAQREAGRELSESEQSSFWTGKAVNFITKNPDQFISLLWKKTVYLFNGFENSDNIDLYFQRQKSSFYSLLLWKIDKVLIFPYGFLVPLFFIGIYSQRQRFKELLPVYLFILAYIPTIILFLVTARHRLPLIPFMIMIAASGLNYLFTQFKKINKKEVITLCLIFIIPFVLVNRPWYQLGYSNEFQSHFNEGIKFFKLNDLVRAEKEYLLADQAWSHSAHLLNNLGYTQFLMGKYKDAEKHYLRALELDKNYSRTYNNYGILLEKRGLLDSAINMFKDAATFYDSSTIEKDEYSQYFLNMGDAYMKKNNLDSAGLSYDAAIGVAPDFGKAYLKSANFYLRQGETVISDSLYQTASQKIDLKAPDYLNWGAAALTNKNYDKGIRLMHEAFNRDNKMYQAPYAIGRAYYDKGAPKDSVFKYLDIALRINPYYPQAAELKTKLMESK